MKLPLDEAERADAMNLAERLHIEVPPPFSGDRHHDKLVWPGIYSLLMRAYELGLRDATERR